MRKQRPFHLLFEDQTHERYVLLRHKPIIRKWDENSEDTLPKQLCRWKINSSTPLRPHCRDTHRCYSEMVENRLKILCVDENVEQMKLSRIQNDTVTLGEWQFLKKFKHDHETQLSCF